MLDDDRNGFYSPQRRSLLLAFLFEGLVVGWPYNWQWAIPSYSVNLGDGVDLTELEAFMEQDLQ